MNIELKKQRERRNYIVRQILCYFLLGFSFVFMSTITTGAPLPLLIIPCAVCYAVREDPFNSALYGCVCGLFLDSASDTLVGFNAIVLMWICLFISLLFHYVLQRNILNFLWLDLIATVIQSFLHYLFFYWIWGYDPTGGVFASIFIPELMYTNIAGIMMFFVTGLIHKTFSTITEHYIEEKSDDIVRE